MTASSGIRCTPSSPCVLDQLRTGRPAADRLRAAEADLHGVDAIGLHARHGVHRPRPVPVQPRPEVVRQRPAEAAHHRPLVRPHRRQAAQPVGRRRQRGAQPGQTGRQWCSSQCSHSSTSKRFSSQRLTPRQPIAPAGPRRPAGTLERQQPHGVQQHRQRSDLVVNHGGQRRLLVPPRRRRQQRPQPGRHDDADDVDAEGEARRCSGG